MTTRTRKITVDEFWAMPDDPGHRYELVDGELVEMDGTPPHGRVTLKIGRLMSDYVDGGDLPLDVGVNTGFAMGGHTLQFPDVHVTRWERMAQYDEAAGGWPQFAPDVAIEVVSPSNIGRPNAEDGRIFRQRDAGCVDSRSRSPHGVYPAGRRRGAGFRRRRYVAGRPRDSGLFLHCR